MFLLASSSSSLIPSHTLRALVDKVHEKRRGAASEIAGTVKKLYESGNFEKIEAIIELLITKYVSLPEVYHRKGGLLGLAGVISGLHTDGKELNSSGLQHLEKIVPPVLSALSDRDSRIRYCACEALYNITKAAKGDIIVYHNEIFGALCKLSADSDARVQSAAKILDQFVKDVVYTSDKFRIEEFILLVIEHMSILNPFVRIFLLSWINAINGLPETDMLGYLPDILDGLFNMLNDSHCEVRDKAASTLSDFLRETEKSSSIDFIRVAHILVRKAASQDGFTRLTVITWILKFVQLGGEELIPYYPDILEVILPSISDKDEKIRMVAQQTNEQVHTIGVSSSEGLNIGAILSVVKRHLSCEWETTRIQALQWIATFLARNRAEVLIFEGELFEALLKMLLDPSTEVVRLLLELLACIARDPQYFNHLVVSLVHEFRVNSLLLKKRGSLIICQLCVLFDAERVYREFAAILEGEQDFDFAYIMVQALNTILLTSSELLGLRTLLKQSLVDDAGKDLFVSLYATWCHSPVATISLALLAQAYQNATRVIQALVEEDLNFKFFVQLDKLVRLLESPTFLHLRRQLLEPCRHIWLVKSLHGLLMLLPQQSKAFKILQPLLTTITSSYGDESGNVFLWDLQFQNSYHQPSVSQISEVGEKTHSVDFAALLQKFQYMKHQHQVHLRSQLHSCSSTSSILFQVNVQDLTRPGEPM